MPVSRTSDPADEAGRQRRWWGLPVVIRKAARRGGAVNEVIGVAATSGLHRGTCWRRPARATSVKHETKLVLSNGQVLAAARDGTGRRNGKPVSVTA